MDVFNGNGITGLPKTANLLQGHLFNIGRVDNAELSDLPHILPERAHLAAVEISLILDVEAVLIEDSYIDSDNPVAVTWGKI